jgi:hypothetical protein
MREYIYKIIPNSGGGGGDNTKHLIYLDKETLRLPAAGPTEKEGVKQ